MEEKNVAVYVSDRNYMMQLSVSLYSLLETNGGNDLCVIVFSDGLSEEDERYLKELAEAFHTELKVERMPDLDQLCGRKLDINKRSTGTYLRLFLTELLPKECHRVLYLDCDTLIRGSLKELFQWDMSEYACLMVKDNIDLAAIANLSDGPYYNAGIMVISLDLWRELDVLSAFFDEVKRRNGNGADADQSYINCLLRNYIGTLPPEYNFMPAFYVGARDYASYIRRYYPFRRADEVYTEQELKQGRDHVRIIHYIGYDGQRPWYNNCVHPDRELWLECLDKTKYKGYVPTEQKKDGLYGNDRGMRLRRTVMKIPVANRLILRWRFGYWTKDVAIPKRRSGDS
ncbi:MAG: glycosyltransferase family 8 protein [Lachnospiraceae bacterium]|nr:glycosyltransferase family 8 protein [Lachnospiraceae bacterium]